ncbi:MAG: GtrA family protein [Candidatus Velthaea sp.]
MSDVESSLFQRVTQRRGLRQFVKFGIVGASGFLVNLIVFTLLQKVDVNHALPFHYYIIYSIAFLTGGVSNYFLNRVWTFRSSGHAGKEGAQFLTVSLIALAVGLGVSYLLEPHLGPGHKTWFISVCAGIFVNFFVNKYWTFRDAE